MASGLCYDCLHATSERVGIYNCGKGILKTQNVTKCPFFKSWKARAMKWGAGLPE